MREQLNRLSSDWNTEYKTVINKITTPKEVQDNVRLEEIAYTSSPDDLDDIEFDALMAGIRREAKYDEVIKSIHLQYLQKSLLSSLEPSFWLLKIEDMKTLLISHISISSNMFKANLMRKPRKQILFIGFHIISISMFSIKLTIS